MDKKDIEKVGKILVSPQKMGIAVTLARSKPLSFTEIKKTLKQTSGALNYHLLVLEKDNVVKKENGKFTITDEGQRVLKVIKDVASM